MCCVLPEYTSMHQVCAVPVEVRRGGYFPETGVDSSHVGVGVEPWFSARATSS